MEGAIETNNIVKLRELLEEHSTPIPESLVSLAVKNKQLEVIKLLVEYGCEISYTLIDYICGSENLLELLVYILQRNPNDTSLIQKIFCRLVLYPCSLVMSPDEPFRIKMFNILLDYGLPINGIIDDTYKYIRADMNKYDCRHKFEKQFGTMTPLHLSVVEGNSGFVSLLLERGADISEKTSKGVSTLALAMKTRRNQDIFKRLLKYRADMNEKTIYKGGNILHVFFDVYDMRASKGKGYDLMILRLLLDNGADPNFLDDHGKPPLKYASLIHTDIVIRELAKLAFENKPICQKNLESLQSLQSIGIAHPSKFFEECKAELQRLKDTNFYNDFSLYDVLKMHKQEKRLILLTKNEDFVAAFESCWNPEAFNGYGLYLDDIFQSSLKKRNILLTEEMKLRSILKDFLPEEIICYVAYFAVEHLFYNVW